MCAQVHCDCSSTAQTCRWREFGGWQDDGKHQCSAGYGCWRGQCTCPRQTQQAVAASCSCARVRTNAVLGSSMQTGRRLSDIPGTTVAKVCLPSLYTFTPALTLFLWQFNFTDTALSFSALTLLVGRQEEHAACKKWVIRCWCGYVWSEVQIVCRWSSWCHCIRNPHQEMMGFPDAVASAGPYVSNPDWFYFSATGLPTLS